MTDGLSLLFPTFPMRTPEFSAARVPGLAPVLERWRARAADVVPLSADTFAVPHPTVLQSSLPETLQAHYATVIEGVAMGEWVEARLGPAHSAAGYSMGLYSALAHSGALPFEDVLRLVTHVCEAAHAQTPPGVWAVGAIVGLIPEVVRALADSHGLEITDRYGSTTWLVTGRRDPVVTALDAALAQGAPATRLLPLTAPFHASVLSSLESSVQSLVQSVRWTAPHMPIVSAITLEPLHDGAAIAAEVVRNAAHPMDWYGTIQRLIALGGRTFVECGASTSLADIIREDFAMLGLGRDFRSFESES